MNFDLHCHSTASDGTLGPSALAARAAANGVEVWALTDHDVLGGLAEARAAAERHGMRFIDGVEISVTWRGQTIHVVGLDVDPTHDLLVAGVRATRGSRRARAERIARELAAEGIPDALEGALGYADDPDLVGRTHFARYLVELGVAGDVREVFQRFLVAGKPGYVPHNWADLADAVHWIRSAGGHAVIAHPGRYKLSAAALESLIDEFQAAGGVAIEVVTGSHSPDQYGHFAALARKHGLHGSRGSDFHGPEESVIDLGMLPPLPAGVRPVIDLIAAHQS
jgi:predicted metal-dependent phosphoesterase TrpH